MNKKSGVLLAIISFLIFLPMIYSAHIIQETDKGIKIEYPPYDYYTYGKDNIIFNFEAFNSSNGILLKNDSVKCSFHLVDNNGNHLIDNDNMLFDGMHYQQILNTTFLIYKGEYYYVVYCNNTIHAGYINVMFEVTSDGTTKTSLSTQLMNSENYIYVFLALLVLFIFLGMVNKYPVLKGICFFFALFEVILLVSFLYSVNIGSMFAPWVIWFNFLMVTIIGFILFWISIMTKSIDLMTWDSDATKQVGLDKFSDNRFGDDDNKFKW